MKKNTARVHVSGAYAVLAMAVVLAWAPCCWASPSTATLVKVGGSDLTFELGATSATTTEKMRLTSTGRLGIGTATPTVALEVSGTISATAFTGNGSGLANVITPTVPVAFLADKNGGTQSLSNQTFTKLTWSREVSDTHNYFSTVNSRFTPKVAGTYLIMLNTSCATTSAQNACYALIYKNGSVYRYTSSNTFYGSTGVTVYATLTVSALVSMNGSTDYVEAYGYIDNSDNYSAEFGYADDGNTSTYFSGLLIR